MTSPFVSLGDVCEINPRQLQLLADHDLVSFLPMAAVSEDGHISFEETRTVSGVRKGYTYFERGDVLLAKITPCFENGKATGTASLRHRVGFGSTEFHVLRPTTRIDANYLKHMVWNARFRDAGAKNMTGSAGQKRVPVEFLKRVQVPLPPLAEQRRIAAILDKADTLRRHRKLGLVQFDEFIDARYDELCAAESRNVFALGEVTEIRSGAGFPDEYQGLVIGEVPFFKVSDMNNVGNEIWMNGAKNYVSRSTASALGAKLHPRGTIIFPKIGAAIATNKKRILSNDSCFDNNVIGVQPRPEKANTLFLYAHLRTVDLMRYAQPGNPPSIRKSTLESAEICMPALSSQNKFANFVSSTWDRKNAAVQSAHKLDALLASLQHRAFSGQL